MFESYFRVIGDDNFLDRLVEFFKFMMSGFVIVEVIVFVFFGYYIVKFVVNKVGI